MSPELIEIHFLVTMESLDRFITQKLHPQGRRDPMSLGMAQNNEFADKVGVACSKGCGTRPTKGIVHSLQFSLKLTEANLIILNEQYNRKVNLPSTKAYSFRFADTVFFGRL